MKSRAEELANIANQQFDLCIIGGGATGAACALDAQVRGIRTVMFDAGDFAGATSSAATKIIHGGVRYLEEAVKGLDVKEYHVLVRALHERVRMLDNAPHLTRRLEFLVPSYSWLNAAYLDIGLKMYDWLAGEGRISPSKLLSREEALKRMPDLRQDGLVGAVEYSDGQFDDARYNITLVQSFTHAGGNTLNHARVTDLQRQADGKLSGVVVKDQFTGTTFSVGAKVIVNATGPFADAIRQMATPTVKRRMRPSKGAHILLPLEVFKTDDALLIPKTDDGRVLFALPWNGRLLVGTTDEEVSVDAELVVTKQDIEFMLGQLNHYVSRPIAADEIVSGYAGMRPLVGSGEEESTAKLARDDVIEVDAASGLISIMGGKWTTHRAMGEDTVTRVQESLNVPVTESPTRQHVLYGGEGYTHDYWKKLAQDYQVPELTAHHLARKFGTASEEVLALKAENPALLQPILAGCAPIQAEVVYSVRHEMAATVEDVLARRIGTQLYSWSDAIDAAPVVGSLLAAELGWSSDAARDAVAQYVAKINHLLQSAGLSYKPSKRG
ncbi:MAG TPA: glycerol-3-phosphate dehydrogenase/oxidase [Verrucomicrobiae bacterium]|jgi:glycerol-3-phosphate dehydrogenase|nr:glycerol-3-phosphate dehydrogenase/oxidase [Verrucomicrobiae bacterium]